MHGFAPEFGGLLNETALAKTPDLKVWALTPQAAKVP